MDFLLHQGEPFDDILQWASKHDVKLYLVSQQSGDVHIKNTVKYFYKLDEKTFIKGISEQNSGFDYHQFIKLYKISASHA